MRWFCSFKSYGDLVIACNCLRQVDNHHYRLLVGSHLNALLDAIHFNGPFQLLEVGSTVPALFDINKCGYLKAIMSGLLLRRRIREVVTPSHDSLVFDRLGIRERFLASPCQIEHLGPRGANIYLDYSNFLGVSAPPCAERQGSLGNRVLVFPDSRIKEKEIPETLVHDIAQANLCAGKTTSIIKIGNAGSFPIFSGADVKWIHGFDRLVEILKTADAVVSADSLPAHLAEYLGIPVFVFTPRPNDYWMPLSSFLAGNFSEFAESSRYLKWVTFP